MDFLEYRHYKKLSEKGSLEERVKAQEKLDAFQKKDAIQSFYYNKWDQTQQAEEKPLPEVKTQVQQSKPVRASQRNEKSGNMTYSQFKETFNRMCDDARLMNTTEESPVRILSRLRNKNPDLYDSYKARMEKGE